MKTFLARDRQLIAELQACPAVDSVSWTSMGNARIRTELLSPSRDKVDVFVSCEGTGDLLNEAQLRVTDFGTTVAWLRTEMPGFSLARHGAELEALAVASSVRFLDGELIADCNVSPLDLARSVVAVAGATLNLMGLVNGKAIVRANDDFRQTVSASVSAIRSSVPNLRADRRAPVFLASGNQFTVDYVFHLRGRSSLLMLVGGASERTRQNAVFKTRSYYSMLRDERRSEGTLVLLDDRHEYDAFQQEALSSCAGSVIPLTGHREALRAELLRIA